MQIIPLQTLPNQNFSFIIDSNQWDMTIKTTNGVSSISILLNGADLLDNIRCVSDMRLIPSKYEEAGNFAFSTLNGDLPDYMQFGITQYLVYFSAVELATIRLPYAFPITASDFDPDGALPLRFEPQGYTLA